LRPLLRRLHPVDPRVAVSLRADELPAFPDNALMLHDADAADRGRCRTGRSVCSSS
jgi:hypothetical protein